jgi:type II secretory pathway component PulF
MLFSQQLSLDSLVGLCRVLRHNLDAGLSLRDVFRQQAERGTAAVRPVAQRIREKLERGRSLEEALHKETAAFPPLFLSMARVGEETGHLPEVFAELESYYTMQLQLQGRFRAQSLLPLVQLVLAFLIIGLLIFVLGAIASSRGAAPPRVFGFAGTAGAVAFLAACFGTMALVYIGFKKLKQVSAFDAVFLRLPALGPCLQALVLSRFSLALHLTLDSALNIGKALRLSLEATGSGVFQAQADRIAKQLQAGGDLTVALTETRLFPNDFLNIVAVAEEGGRLPEVMKQQAAYYHEEAQRRMKVLTRMLSLSVWLIYAGIMIAAIFHLAGIYLGALGKGPM